MDSNSRLSQRLHSLGADVKRWRVEEGRLRAAANRALASRHVAPDMLVKMEHSAGALYAEIDAFNLLVGEVASQSPAAAAELGAVSDALHLLLLDVTELGTRLYSIHSLGAVEPADQPAALAVPEP